MRKGSVSSVVTLELPIDRRMMKPAPSRCERAVKTFFEEREGMAEEGKLKIGGRRRSLMFPPRTLTIITLCVCVNSSFGLPRALNLLFIVSD